MKKTFLGGIILMTSLFAISCQLKTEEKKEEIKKEVEIAVSEGDKIINEAIKAHGGNLYDNAYYSFIFRKNEYSFKNSENSYIYTVKRKVEDKIVEDILDNGSITRTINGESVELNERDKLRYSEALNSVIYFATLPYKLNDAAVNKEFKREVTIKNETYKIVQVTFNQEGGGKDFEDQFYYWVNSKTHTIDYLAYNYKVNNGGVRFRSSYNKRNIGGIIFQDYINYKAEVGTPLSELPKLYEEGKLKELSKIETENVVNLNSN
ncbi:DUF6503 family protein [Tenacibaculum jejuense]|uniref:Lipoprotein n=1 Tax=Tenacibaculum jejuense TaxID=584609 RepID=A0A238U5S9_9FLAO|nr:DUF6503 family protein [Tenacibaculum jejuense]SNR13968.1 conserved protein of unknown function [Tenacibaculum jejuense]